MSVTKVYLATIGTPAQVNCCHTKLIFTKNTVNQTKIHESFTVSSVQHLSKSTPPNAIAVFIDV
ncbi:hypothetical protein [Iningainema tapete]|uniref:Uncharacterized protein n=1 Tax=Iningainema tapete BLCC-T55 TaxID=2748662 RepID=A0A8J7CGU8_9CYAN|nr:hypothetical protein [Iningainema tapete]MBD2776865.1 hypothetical protein [Iningainema tapete BLCC-T55]